MSHDTSYWKYIREKTNSERIDLKNPKPSLRALFQENKLFPRLFPILFGHDYFIKKSLKSVKSTTDKDVNVLDIGCGEGIAYAKGIKNTNFHGVDITGFPKEITIKHGYTSAIEYDKNGEIPFDNQSMDTFLLINVNAHITDNLLISLLNNAKNKLIEPQKEFFMVIELNNYGISYKILRFFSKEKLTSLIAKQDHINFLFEEEFDDLLLKNGIQIKNKATIYGDFLPYTTYELYFLDKNSFASKLRWLYIPFNIFVSIFENLLRPFSGRKKGNRHMVGYTCSFSK